MKIINASVKIEAIDGYGILRDIEAAGRTAYKSEDAITSNSAKMFVDKIIRSGHHSVLEHRCVSARVVCDRGISHEIVRHRIASYTQESTRYCNYSKKKFGNEITFILPQFLTNATEDSKLYAAWKRAMEESESVYLWLLENGASPQEARSVLPNSLKTEIVMTMNLREWRHFFTVRTAPNAHPDMQVIAKELLARCRQSIPVVFDDVG